MGRTPTTPEQAINFSKRDELVAETSAIKFCELTKIKSNKTNNLVYLKEFLSKFGDDKAVQKAELGKALIESNKVVDLTKNKYRHALKHQTVSNNTFNNALQMATKKLGQRNVSNQITKHQGIGKGIIR